MKRALLALLVAAVALLTPSSLQSSVASPNLVAAVGALQWYGMNPYTGAITRENHCTVGFINDKKDYWLTAAHCVTMDGTTVAPIQFYIDGVEAEVVFTNFFEDLAVLHSRHDGKPLRLSKTNIWWLSEVQMAGYPLGVGPFLVRGRVANPNWTWTNGRSWTIYDMAGCPGNSGSPVVNGKGEVIGVLQIGFSTSCGSLMGGALLTNVRAQVGRFFE